MSVPVRSVLDRKGYEVATVGERVALADAARELTRRGIGALVVVDAEQAVLGICSERDIVRAVAEGGGQALTEPVSRIMSADVVTCGLDSTVDELAAIMTTRRVRHVPVLDGGRLAGIVSIGDVVKSRMDELSVQAESLALYVTGSAY